MSVTFYWLVDCVECDHSFHFGPVASVHDDRRGLPVIPIDFVPEAIDCPRCNVRMYFGNVYDDVFTSKDDEDDDEVEEETSGE